jgi:hypothetical protein
MFVSKVVKKEIRMHELCSALVIGESAEGQRDRIRNVTKETIALSRSTAP